MAEGTTPEGATTESAAGTAPQTPATQNTPATPPLGRWLLIYSLGRIVIMVALVALFWLVGIPQLPALLFGVLLSMPVAYVLLRPTRDRVTAALIARTDARRTAKERLRARLAGDEDPAED